MVGSIVANDLETGYGLSNQGVEVSKEPEITDGWWSARSLFDLECRAIFTKSWIPVVHRSRFRKPGDYISLPIAGLSILIILGKDHVPRTFHNVCRHRAYAVANKAAGSSLVLGCKYHGWSYSTKGELVKAPQFDGLDGFNKAENKLFPVHTCVDRTGILYVNLAADEDVGAPDCSEVTAFTAEAGIPQNREWNTGWEMKGNFNWKVPAHLNLPFSPSHLRSEFSLLSLMSSLLSGPPAPTPSPLSIMPSTTIIPLPGRQPLLLSIIVLPLTPSTSTIRFDLYYTGNLKKADPEAIISQASLEALKKNAESWIKDLESRYTDLQTSIPSVASGSKLERQYVAMIAEHAKLERDQGVLIFPSKIITGAAYNDEATQRAEKLCKELEDMENFGQQEAPCRKKEKYEW